MNIANVLLRPFGLKISNATLRDKDSWFTNWLTGGMTTDAGVSINNNTAMQISTVFACIRIISEDVGKIPLQVFRKEKNGRQRDDSHPLNNIFNNNPNPEMTAMSFRQTLMGHVLAYGNGYAEIVRDATGQVAALWPLLPDRVTPKRDSNGLLYYEYKNVDGTTTSLSQSKIFPIPGFSFDGIQGYNVIHYARQSLGLARAAERFGAKFFGNGAKSTGVIEVPGRLTEKAFKNLKTSVEQQISGDNIHRMLLLEEGAAFKPVSLSPEDSQFLETRQFSIPEVCRWFRMPPHKVADLSRATFSNIEHQSLEYVSDTLMSWFVRWEQAISRSLLTPQERQAGLYLKHNANALLRGDIQARYNAYGRGINDGWLLRNEARELEELNPLDGLDEPLVPLNMGGASQVPADNIVDDISKRIANAEIRGLSRRADKAKEDREKFNEWVDEFYIKHETYVRKCLEPICQDDHLAHEICENGSDSIKNCDTPVTFLLDWDRKSQIKEIINEVYNAIPTNN